MMDSDDIVTNVVTDAITVATAAVRAAADAATAAVTTATAVANTVTAVTAAATATTVTAAAVTTVVTTVQKRYFEKTPTGLTKKSLKKQTIRYDKFNRLTLNHKLHEKTSLAADR
ncbi:uncharacterized protein SPSK_06739 [Sporothrix schenckii 1099-18]|uniref:Uncharacterized protein n=1 Tax=Sporothrix schenckii 1099-18 TaxID=1397361 RepID=A0A0F2MKA1_SPOSC|nr:uncharacterized protein SPSK_06739 [Sporothrix schenckii 1099-18]KJR89479.1 hypothetical protein SPSK_06739 [Sporothrix schenckii 1099-18]